MITSTSNPKVKELALLGKNVKERKKQGIFLAEGKKMVSEAPKGWIQKAYVSETCLLSGEFADVLEGLEHEALSDHVMRNTVATGDFGEGRHAVVGGSRCFGKRRVSVP